MELKGGYKQTEVGIIPETWQCCPLGDVVDLLTGLPFPSKEYVQSGTRLLRGSNVKRGSIDWTEKLTAYWPSITNEIKKYSLKAGDIVVAMDGSLVGRSFASLGKNDVPSLLLQRVARIRSANVAQAYLKVWVCSQQFTNHCDVVKTASSIPHISPGDILSFKIALPPTEAEQKAIAEALSDADTLIKALDQLVVKKHQIKQAAMQELLTGKRRLPGFNSKWATKSLGDLGDFLKGAGVRKDEALSGNLPCIRYGEIYTKHNDWIKEFQSWISTAVAATATRINYGDVLFAASGETKEEIGKCVAYVGKHEAYAGGDIVILRTRLVDPLFLGYYLNTEPVRQQKACRGQGDAVVHIGANSLAAIKVTLPSIDEQTAIATILSDMDTELTALETRLAKAQQIKQGMMQELLTGRIRLL